jgi:hypothetical protein
MDPTTSRGSELTEANLKLLISSRAVAVIRVVSGIKGYVIEARYGEAQGVLSNTRRGERRFASIDAAGRLLKRLGAPVFTVDVSGPEPGLVRKPRPDRAAPHTSSAPKVASSSRTDKLEFSTRRQVAKKRINDR